MISFLVTGQQLRIVTPIIVSDTLRYLTARAQFKGEGWAECSKWAHFIKDGNHYTVPFHNDEISAADNVALTAGTWQVYITGHAYNAELDEIVTRITSSTAYLKVESAELAEPFPFVTPNFSEVLAGEAERAVEIAQGVREDAAAGAFDGATFRPEVSADGTLSWTNDKGLDNPQSVYIKGERGENGRGLTILGYYETQQALEEAVAFPYAGDAYGVGAAQPYEVYVWDAVNEVWVNNGPVQGAKGEPGEPGQDGAPGAPGAPGYTPQKGVDYWTQEDIQQIGASISPTDIGAIANPEAKASGQYLKYDGTAWIAEDVASGVSSVDGQSGEVVTRLVFANTIVSSWGLQTNPTYPDFPYAASIALSGVTANMSPDVIFSYADAASGRFCCIAKSYTGGIYIYANAAPSGNISIPLIVAHVCGNSTGRTNSAAIAANSISRAKLASDALYSPIQSVPTTPYSVIPAHIGKTLVSTWSVNSSDIIVDIPNETGKSFPNGTEIAFHWLFGNSYTITMHNLRVSRKGEPIIGAKSLTTISINEINTTIALKKISTENNGDIWVVTGDCEVAYS